MPFQIERIQFFLDGQVHSKETVSKPFATLTTATAGLSTLRNKVAQNELSPARSVPKLTTEVMEGNVFEVLFSTSITDGTWRRYRIIIVE